MPDVLVDSNVFIAVLIEEEQRFDDAKQLLDSDYDLSTSILNLMEIRTVLAKKKQVSREDVERMINEVSSSVEVVLPDTRDFLAANRLQRETYLYPSDSLILATADNAGLDLVSFDSELLEHGAQRPSNLLA